MWQGLLKPGVVTGLEQPPGGSDVPGSQSRTLLRPGNDRTGQAHRPGRGSRTQ
jgi:hypothetical protein